MSAAKVNEILIEIINMPAPLDRVNVINAACRLSLAERDRCVEIVRNLAKTAENNDRGDAFLAACDLALSAIMGGQ